MSGISGSVNGPPPCKMKKGEKEYNVDEETMEFDEETQSLEKMDVCQTEIDELNERSATEILSIEKKFKKLRKPCFDRRNEMISRIPHFWVTAMVNHPQISLLISEDEEDCLHFLHKVEVEDFDDIKSGFRLKLFFDENPFFENDVLVKEFHLGIDGEAKSTSSDIQWKELMDLTKRKLAGEFISLKRQRKRQPKTFFTWFNDHENPFDDNIAQIIRNELWPNPLLYYLVSEEEKWFHVDEVENEEEDEEEGSSIIEEEDDEEDESDEDDSEDWVSKVF